MSQSNETIDPYAIPVLSVIAQSCLLPFRAPFILLLSTFLVAFILVGGGATFVLFPREKGSLPPGGWFTITLYVFAVFLSMAAYFNLWIRYGVMRDARAWQQGVGSWIRQSLWTMFNLFWIGILVALGCIVILVPVTLLASAMIPTLNGVPEIFESQGVLAQLIMLGIFLPFSLVITAIYAVFSLNIVESALGERYVSAKLDRYDVRGGVFRFAVILTAVYLAGEFASLLFASFENQWAPAFVVSGLQGLVYFYGIAIIGAAHGVVFRLKTGRTGTQAEDLGAGQREESDAPDSSGEDEG